ncbi:MAG: hypothetical protein ABI266_10420 [Ginsengibacter sp.]
MKRFITMLAFLFLVSNAFTQVEKDPIKIVSSTFEKDYNIGA